MPSCFNQLSTEDRNKILTYLREKAFQNNRRRRIAMQRMIAYKRKPYGNGQAPRRGGGCNCGR